MKTDTDQPFEETLKQALHTEHLEAILLPFEGDELALVRSTRMPELAFLIWTKSQRGTYSILGLDFPDGETMRYWVACACCPSHTYGITKPDSVGDKESDSHKEWCKTLEQPFKEALASTCGEHGITTVFVRNAERWEPNYGNLDGISFVEAERHADAMLELYGRKVVREGTAFISRHHSRGMG